MVAKKCVMKRMNEGNKSYESIYEEFIISRKVSNVRPDTLRFYQHNLKAFKDYLRQNGIESLYDLKENDINNFILWLKDKYENSITINTYLRASRAFINFAISQNYMQPTKIRLIKQEKPIKEVYTEEEIKKLIKKPNLKSCSFAEYRDWVLVQYFLETGNRLGTVLNIKVKDVNLNAGMVTLRTTKNRNSMFSPLGSSLGRIIYEYVKAWGLEEDSYLFPNVEGKQMTKNSITNAIRRYNKSRNVQKTSIHCFRHTFAKNYIMKGGNAFKLQRLLGHSSLTITEQYISLFAGDLAKDFDQFSIIDEFSSNHKIKRSKSAD